MSDIQPSRTETSSPSSSPSPSQGEASFSMYQKADPVSTPQQPEPPFPWNLLLRDQVGKPIVGLNLWLHIDGKEYPFTTNLEGKVSDIPRSQDPIKVEVDKHTGGRKAVGEVKLMPHTEGVVLTSPKVKIEGRTRPHEPKADGGPDSKGGDPLKGVFRTAARNSCQFLAYQCHSANYREKSLWLPSPQVKGTANQCAGGFITKFGGLTMRVLGRGNSYQTRDQQGHPVTVVGLESWDGKLALGPNEKWRPALKEAVELDSVKKTGIKIFALAALINAEAGTKWIKETEEVPVKDKKGNPVIDRKTKKPVLKKKIIKIDNGWDETIHNTSDPKSDAAGLTQFIINSWCGMAADPNTQLGQYARKRGWIEMKEILRGEKGVRLYDPHLAQRLERLEKAQKDYELALKKPVNPKSKKHHQPPKPPGTMKRPFVITASNYTKLLALREDGRMSILTAAEAMAMNFVTLQRGYGFKVDSVKNSFEVAKLAYLLHFLGPDQAVKLIRGTMEEKTAKYLLLAQFHNNENEAKEFLTGGDLDTKWVKGLWKFTKKICDERMENGFEKYCQPKPKQSELGNDISTIVEEIK